MEERRSRSEMDDEELRTLGIEESEREEEDAASGELIYERAGRENIDITQSSQATEMTSTEMTSTEMMQTQSSQSESAEGV